MVSYRTTGQPQTAIGWRHGKGRIYPCRDNALQDCGATETERRVCEETHRMEQRDPATGLRQGLHRQCSQV